MDASSSYTRQQAAEYRSKYDSMSFAEKQHAINVVLKENFQIVPHPHYLLGCLGYMSLPKNFRVVELGGYDGSHALSVLQRHPDASWLNYDISHVAQERTRRLLGNSHYQIKVLTQPFHQYNILSCDIFYTSKTLEHMRRQEILDTLSAAQQARYQVHVIDWWWKDDTHVIEKGSHRPIVKHLKELGYKPIHVKKHPYQSFIFMEKPA